jgi:hypothetical protein
MYVAAHYSGAELNMAKIFSTLEVIFSFKFSIMMLSLGLGFYHEAKVVFSRFASIFRIKNIAMVQFAPKQLKSMDMDRDLID